MVKLSKILNSEAVIKSGNNGPYGDPETEVRNNAHWSIIFLQLGKTKKGEACLDKLLAHKSRPFMSTVFMRNKKGKDRCNGLIGQAWVIEALMHGYDFLGEDKYDDLARKVFLLHKQTKSGYWKRRDIDGTVLSVDKTFNHQLWFAAAGSMITTSQEDQIGQQINHFINHLEKNISLHKNGAIRHLIWPKITTPVHLIKSRKSPKYLYNKGIGYHAFNLYALAILKEGFPNHTFWNSKKFRKILNFALSSEHIDIAEKNKYGFQYNPSGIELAYFVHVFKNQIKDWKQIAKKSLERQFKNHLNKKTLIMNQNTDDPNTLAARIYEATRLPDFELDL